MTVNDCRIDSHARPAARVSLVSRRRTDRARNTDHWTTNRGCMALRDVRSLLARSNSELAVVADAPRALRQITSSVRARNGARDPVEDHVRRRIEQDQFAAQETIVNVVR